MTISIPLALRNALELGEGVLFLGAGVGGHIKGHDGNPLPSGEQLAKEIGDKIGVSTAKDLAKIAYLFELRKGRTELDAFIASRFSVAEPDDTFKWLFSLRWRAIFTTNYDAAVERAYQLQPTPKQNPIIISATADLRPCDPRFEVPVYHLHGRSGQEKKASFVITPTDYARFRERRRMVFEHLKNAFATSTIIYIGYSNRDPNWSTLLSEIEEDFLPTKLPASFKISPDNDPVDDEILSAKGINSLTGTLDDFVKQAMVELPAPLEDKDRLKALKSVVPAEFQEAFDKNPAPVARLLKSWTYVNQENFGNASNTSAFFRGDRPNWSLIAAGVPFERDIEEEVYDEALDYLTGTSKSPTAISILGPAGYGTTTFLMMLAARVVKERAAAVFMLRPGAELLEGDIQFAATLVKGLCMFVVDNAADHAVRLGTVKNAFRDAKQPALFIFGERLNEWRTSSHPSSKEHLLEPLSEPEINRLIACLEKNGELGTLRDLPMDLRIAAIKSRHGKELLVTLREATEGRSFDAILEDEFRSIPTDLARQAYLTTCCFFQFGAVIRDGLLGKLLATDLPELYRLTNDALEGVVVYEALNDASGSFGARARHRTIAEIVWQRCGDPGLKEHLLQSALDGINFNFKPDRDAFESFYRSDDLIDGIRTLDAKTRFFDTACKKDPDGSYVRQHYARMLNRSDKPEIALSQIDEALRLSPNARVLHHTKGIILKNLALSSIGDDIARKRMAQSEASFRQGLRLAPKDEFCYQGLAELFLGWAKRSKDPVEIADYIGKAEDIINEGLKVVRSRDGLYIISSEISRWLGDNSSRVKALADAVRTSPGSVIARYLLGRAYREEGRAKEALDVLKPVISQAPEQYRCYVEYALAAIDDGHPLTEAIAILRQAERQGMADSRFISILGGLLFLNAQYTESEGVFSEHRKREFGATEIKSVNYRSLDPKTHKPLRYPAKVVGLKPGYAVIEVRGLPRLICPGSKFAGTILKVGLTVSIELGFSCRGPIAENPRVS